MTSPTPNKFIAGLMMVLLTFAVDLIALVVGTMEVGPIATWGTIASTAAIAVAAAWALHASRCDEDSVHLRAAFLFAIVFVIAMGGAAVSIHLDRFIEGGDRKVTSPMQTAVTDPNPIRSRTVDQKSDIPLRSDRPPLLSERTPRSSDVTLKNKNQAAPDMPQAVVDEVNQMIQESDKAAKAGQANEADNLLEQAIGLIDMKSPKSLYQRGQVSGTLARLRFGAGKAGEGMDVIDAHIAKLEQAGDSAAAAAFHELSGELLGNQEMLAESLERFDRALDIRIELHATPNVIASIYAKIAISHARMNDKKKAADAVKKARELLKSVSPEDTENIKRLDNIVAEYGL